MSKSASPPLESSPLLGVVIITYQSSAVIASCLRSLQNLPVRVAVVDNASTDGSAEIARTYRVMVIENSTNRGFAAAANQGFQALPNDYILLLNPDVTVTPNLPELLAGFATGNVGAVSAPLCGPGGELQHQFQFRRFPSPVTLLFEVLGFNRLFPSNPVNQHYRYFNHNWNLPCELQQPAGAFLLIRRQAWGRLGGFDEGFHPLWFEDVDFCLRLSQNRWSIRYLPQKAGIHQGAHSIRNLEPALRQLYWYRSLLRYTQKHFSAFWVRVLAASVVAALGGKALMMALHRGQTRDAAAVWPAMSTALHTLLHGRRPSSGFGAA